MRWIKASDRNPPSTIVDTYHVKVKYTDLDDSVLMPSSCTFSGEWEEDENIVVVEWLDESIPTQSGEKKTDFQVACELMTSKDKPFFISNFRDLLKLFDKEEISMSKLVEELNVAAVKWANTQLSTKEASIKELVEGLESHEVKMVMLELALLPKNSNGRIAYEKIQQLITKHKPTTP